MNIAKNWQASQNQKIHQARKPHTRKKQHIFEPHWKKVLFYSAVLTDDEGMVEIKQALAIPNEDVTSEVARIRSQLCFNYLKINFR
jgi:hypothetical protein